MTAFGAPFVTTVLAVRALPSSAACWVSEAAKRKRQRLSEPEVAKSGWMKSNAEEQNRPFSIAPALLGENTIADMEKTSVSFATDVMVLVEKISF